MKVSYLYDQGSAQYREDGLFIVDPFFGVLDGVSAPFGSKYPMQKFNGLSGGEFVARTVERFFSTVIRVSSMSAEAFAEPPESRLSIAITEVNNLVRNSQERAGVEVRADRLAGATFAIVWINQSYVEIIQAGDCFALFVEKDGSVGITRNQVRYHDGEMNDTILRIQREVAHELFGKDLEDISRDERSKIRSEMWDKFFPILSEARVRDVNRPESTMCYGLLNGQPELRDIIIRLGFDRSKLRAILLFSDGMIPWETMKGVDDEEIAQRIWLDFQKGGLPCLLQIARGIEKHVEVLNYTDSAEATAIAIEF